MKLINKVKRYFPTLIGTRLLPSKTVVIDFKTKEEQEFVLNKIDPFKIKEQLGPDCFFEAPRQKSYSISILGTPNTIKETDLIEEFEKREMPIINIIKKNRLNKTNATFVVSFKKKEDADYFLKTKKFGGY